MATTITSYRSKSSADEFPRAHFTVDNSFRDAAVAATERGWAVSPSIPGTKRAMLKWGTQDDWSNDPDEVATKYASYWRRGSNPLIITGPSRLLVVDLDNKNGLNGVEAWHEITGWPWTFAVDTPHGIHFTSRHLMRPGGTPA